jgi:hypothetical protein
MIDKRLTVVLYGSDRNLWSGGPLQIRVTDVFAPSGPRELYRGETPESTLELRLGLPFDAGQVYGITFFAPDHRPAWQLVRRADFIRMPQEIEGDDLILRLMLVPDSPGSTDLPKGLDRLAESASPFAAVGSGIDTVRFAACAPAAKMAFLNIEAKLRETIIAGAPLLSFVRGVRHVAADRVFLFFDAALKARMSRAIDFAGAPGHAAPKGLVHLGAHPDSWKHTRFAEGNVQLSFARDAQPFPDGAAALVHSADVDIDLGRGPAHATEWLVNNVFRPGHKTDQTLVYGLLFAQGILPYYTLAPAAATTRSVVPPLTLLRVAPERERERRRRRSVRTHAPRRRRPVSRPRRARKKTQTRKPR